MALNASNSSNFEQLALKGLIGHIILTNSMNDVALRTVYMASNDNGW